MKATKKRHFHRKINPDSAQTHFHDQITLKEAEILSRISELKRQKIDTTYLCSHIYLDQDKPQVSVPESESSFPFFCLKNGGQFDCDQSKPRVSKEFEKDKNYYDEFWREFLFVLIQSYRASQLEKQVNAFEHSILQIENQINRRQALLQKTKLGSGRHKKISKNSFHSHKRSSNSSPSHELKSRPIRTKPEFLEWSDEKKEQPDNQMSM